MPQTAAQRSAPLHDLQEGDRPAPNPFAGGSLGDALGRPGALSSPAARLQATLGAEFADIPGEERWPLRLTVAAVFTTCGAFWTAVYFVVAALIG